MRKLTPQAVTIQDRRRRQFRYASRRETLRAFLVAVAIVAWMTITAKYIAPIYLS